MSMAKTYALVFGIVYVAVALLELLFKNVAGTLFFTPVHNAIHWLTGVLGLVAYGMGDKAAKTYAQVFGVVFTLVAVLGWFAPDMLATIIGYRVNLVYNLVHTATGLLGLYVGFGGKMKKMPMPV